MSAQPESNRAALQSSPALKPYESSIAMESVSSLGKKDIQDLETSESIPRWRKCLNALSNNHSSKPSPSNATMNLDHNEHTIGEASGSKSNTQSKRNRWNFKLPEMKMIPSEAAFPIATMGAKPTPRKVIPEKPEEEKEGKQKQRKLKWPKVELIPSESVFPVATTGSRRR